MNHFDTFSCEILLNQICYINFHWVSLGKFSLIFSTHIRFSLIFSIFFKPNEFLRTHKYELDPPLYTMSNF
ncbi:hypothetical protein HanPI659440_Chr11g0404991 [Helianthus annuus]|nr:hypothetical protein HanPI659440_Chr11g0404991 [Helianthus annuus]